MYRLRRLLWVVLLASASSIALLAQNARWVDPFLGSDGQGNVFPGATLPFGMVKAGPDVANSTANAGWLAKGAIQGFSQTHVSGTGGGAKYGNILVQPTTGTVTPADHGSPRAEEHASAGRYGVTLARYGIKVDVTASRRATLYRFTYPQGAEANLLFDVAHCLSSYANQNEDQRVTASQVTILAPEAIQGSSTVTGGWNQQKSTYTVYFYAKANVPAASFGTWQGAATHEGSHQESTNGNTSTGAWMRFAIGTRSVRVKVGISFVSTDQARHNAETEIAGYDFERTAQAAVAAWDKALSGVTMGGASEDAKRQFYTALYHTMLMPADRTGENPLWQSNEPSYDDFYAIWDTFRSSSPLLTILAPEREAAIVRSLVDIYRHDGFLPDARSGNYNGRTQGGSNAEMVIADAYLKHLRGIDWETAYRAVKHDAEDAPQDQMKEGRGGLEDWKRLGYLTIEGVDRPISKHMEYAANDYAISLIAAGLGKQSDAKLYRKRAQNWKNLWDTEASDAGFRGFVWARHHDGQWRNNFDPLLTGTWGSDSFYEGNTWTYSTYVPQDVAGLIAACGGKRRFVNRMDAFFTLPGRYDVGNEPGFLAPYLYLWAGRPDRTQYWIRNILDKSYHSGPQGLPGNDDSGAMSSWYAFGRLGFYPNAAQDVYLIGSPSYPIATLRLANGRSFTIKAVNSGPNRPYIHSATWNGKPYERPWFTHEQLMRGGTLRLVMSDKPSDWGAHSQPPSLSDARPGAAGK